LQPSNKCGNSGISQDKHLLWPSQSHICGSDKWWVQVTCKEWT
jgi:hypothetical protein